MGGTLRLQGHIPGVSFGVDDVIGSDSVQNAG